MCGMTVGRKEKYNFHPLIFHVHRIEKREEKSIALGKMTTISSYHAKYAEHF